MVVETVKEKMSSTWWLVLLQGIAVLILGILLLAAPEMTVTVLVQFLGAFFLISGFFSIITIFIADAGVHWGWLLLGGIVGILAGIAVLRHPLYSSLLVSTTLVIIIAIAGLIKGIISLVRGFKGEGGWAIILGILYLIIGVILLTSALITTMRLTLLIGIVGTIGGIVLIFFAFRMRGQT